MRSTFEASSGARFGGSLGVTGVGVQSELSSAQQRSELESRVLHHDLLVRTEGKLFEANLAYDLNGIDSATTTVEELRGACQSYPYIRAEGWATIEDYKRIQGIAEDFHELIEFIGRSALDTAGLPDQATAILRRVDKAYRTAATESNIDRKGKLLLELEEAREGLRKLIGATNTLQSPDEWLLRGIRRWIEIFMRDRVVLRVYPFESVPQFHLLANLKSSSFLDADLENVLFAYGARPNLRLSVFGLVTSMPPQQDVLFDPMTEFDVTPVVDDPAIGMEKAFRGLFRAMEGFAGLRTRYLDRDLAAGRSS